MNKEIKELLQLFEESSIAKMELEVDDLKIKLEKFQPITNYPIPHQTPVMADKTILPATQPSTDKAPSMATHTITAPLVGTLYHSREQGGKPLVSVGDSVKIGDTLCIIEAMKVMNEIRSDKEGTILSIHAENESMVQFQQELFVIAL